MRRLCLLVQLTGTGGDAVISDEILEDMRRRISLTVVEVPGDYALGHGEDSPRRDEFIAAHALV